MLNLLKNNFGLKVLAVGLAIAAWGFFHLAAAPGTTARFDESLSVPIVVTGLKTGFIARYDDKFADVIIQRPRSGPDIQRDQVQAVLDVSDLVDPGYHNVPVKIVSPDVVIRSLSPASVTLSLDRLEERVVPVSFVYTGSQRAVVVDSAAVTPQVATIRGVATDLAKVTGVRVAIDIPSSPQRLDTMIRPAPTSARGDEVAGVQVSPNLVRVRARFVAPNGFSKPPHS